MSKKLLNQYKKIITGMPVRCIWHGHGSAIFFEIGNLSYPESGGKLQNNPDGEYTIMIEWDWRIENKSTILCGSSTEEDDLKKILEPLHDKQILSLSVTKNIPEIKIEISGSFIIQSFMTDADDPQWAIIDQSENGLPTLTVENGILIGQQ